MKSLKSIQEEVREALHILGFGYVRKFKEIKGLYILKAKSGEDRNVVNTTTVIEACIRNVDNVEDKIVPAVVFSITTNLRYVTNKGKVEETQRSAWTRDFYSTSAKAIADGLREWLKENRFNLYYGK